jgi:oxalate---CoA ligase
VATERELRDFVNEKLAAFKVPNRVYFLSEIPKGATGKLQRIGLAQKLGLA